MENGYRRIVRNGYSKPRKILSRIGEIDIRVPRAIDRVNEEELIKYHSKIVPPYIRKIRFIEALLPWLYLKGISTGDFPEALSSILGSEAKGISANTISRLKKIWEQEYINLRKRDLSEKHYVYFWVDGIYSNIRMDRDNLCLLVIVGATVDGKKELVALEEGYRESRQSWKEILIDLRMRGLKKWPKIAVGDGAMGFWSALRNVCPDTKEQRCWMHKTGNILNYLPKRLHSKTKYYLHEIWMADTKRNAIKAFNKFVEIYESKYHKAIQCLKKIKKFFILLLAKHFFSLVIVKKGGI